MNISRPFILRPVATALLMAALLLSGVLAYRLLPVSALPQVDYPTIRILTFYPGASPEVMTSAVTAPLERQFGQMPGPRSDVVDELGRRVGHHAALLARRSRSRSPSRKCRRRSTPPATCCRTICRSRRSTTRSIPADTPVLTLAVTSRDGAAAAGPRPRRHARRAEAVAAARRRPGQHRRRPAAGRAHPGQPAGARGARPEPAERCATVIAAANVNQPKGNFDGPERSFMLDANDQLRSPEAYRDLIVAYRDGAPLRLSDVARGRRRRREPPARGVGQRRAGGAGQRPAPARRQRHRGRRPHPRRCCRSSPPACRRR